MRAAGFHFFAAIQYVNSGDWSRLLFHETSLRRLNKTMSRIAITDFFSAADTGFHTTIPARPRHTAKRRAASIPDVSRKERVMMNTSTQKTEAAKSQSSNRDFLVFTLGQEEYGVALLNVRELRSHEVATCIANVPNFVKGVINLRGTIVPILDMRIKLNLESAAYDASTVVIILDIEDRVVGVVVDGVTDVVTLAGDKIKPAPDLGAAANRDYLIGLGMLDERMLILVDMGKLVSFDAMQFAEKLAA